MLIAFITILHTKYDNIRSFVTLFQECLRSFRPSPSGPFGIETEVVENYIRSCAGYSIICYILGIGKFYIHFFISSLISEHVLILKRYIRI